MKANIVTLVIVCGCFVTLVLTLALFFIRRWNKSKEECDHAFILEEVADLNRDPKCKYCKKYLSAIDPHHEFKFTWDETRSMFRLTKILRK